MSKKYSTGLVLEGGGFRGIYSAGVLDCLLENDILLPYIIGVSMGACNAVNYISKQKGRNLSVPYTYINDKRYLSYRRLLTKGELFGMDFIFREIPEKLIPFDFDTFYTSKQKLVICATDCESGKPVYLDDFSKYDLMESLKASTSLPFAQKMIRLNGMKLLDGGISDSIPVKKALDDGCKKLIVILTQVDGYSKKAASLTRGIKLRYRKYPQLVEAIKNRHNNYNNTLAYIKKLEEEGTAFVIRPERAVPIGRVEKDREKLQEAFDIGYQQCRRILPEIQSFLKTEKQG